MCTGLAGGQSNRVAERGTVTTEFESTNGEAIDTEGFTEPSLAMDRMSSTAIAVKNGASGCARVWLRLRPQCSWLS